MNSKKFYVVLGCAVLSLLVFAGVVYTTMEIPGQRDKPHLENKRWKELFVRYEQMESKYETTSRTFMVRGKELDALKQRFKTKDVHAAFNFEVDTHLVCRDGGVWCIMPASPTQLLLCNVRNKEQAYGVVLENRDFYEKLRELCAEHAKQFIPDTQVGDIGLCAWGDNSRRVVLPKSKLVTPPDELPEFCDYVKLQVVPKYTEKEKRHLGSVILLGPDVIRSPDELAPYLKREVAWRCGSLEWKEKDISAKNITVVIRADVDTKIGYIQQMIQVCQQYGFEKFALRVRYNADLEGDFSIRTPINDDPDAPPPTTVLVRIKANASGELTDIGIGDRNFRGTQLPELGKYVRSKLGGSGPLAAAFTIIEVDCDYDLRYEHVIDVISVMTGYVENGKVVKIAENIAFRSPRKPY